MQNENITINLENGLSELVIREGEAVKLLEPKAPIKTDISGTIETVTEYLSKRINANQFLQEDCHILVNRDDVSITLIINEADEYRRGQIVGRLSYNPKFLEFGINQNKVWTPSDLGLFIKMNRAFFQNKKENMELVTTLMNFNAVVNQKIERSIADNGSRTDNFAQVVNSNLPSTFTIQMPIFKGMRDETIEVETFAQVNGREVAFVLMSPGVQTTLEEIRNAVIDTQLGLINGIAPNIAIIEV